MNIGIVIAASIDRNAEMDIAVAMAEDFVHRNVGSKVYASRLYRGGEYGSLYPARFALVGDILSLHDYALWMDVDTCLVDPTFDLESALGTWSTPSTRLWIAQDWNGLCACCFVARNCEWCKDFLKTVGFLAQLRDRGGQKEQAVLKMMLYDVPGVAWHLGLLPTSVVADQTVKPIPTPLLWHLSMGEKRVQYMKEVQSAVSLGVFEQYAKGWDGMGHGVRYD